MDQIKEVSWTRIQRWPVFETGGSTRLLAIAIAEKIIDRSGSPYRQQKYLAV